MHIPGFPRPRCNLVVSYFLTQRWGVASPGPAVRISKQMASPLNLERESLMSAFTDG